VKQAMPVNQGSLYLLAWSQKHQFRAVSSPNKNWVSSCFIELLPDTARANGESGWTSLRKNCEVRHDIRRCGSWS